jgi:hypothetical protein
LEWQLTKRGSLTLTLTLTPHFSHPIAAVKEEKREAIRRASQEAAAEPAAEPAADTAADTADDEVLKSEEEPAAPSNGGSGSSNSAAGADSNPFVDVDFPPTAASLFGSNSPSTKPNWSALVWRKARCAFWNKPPSKLISRIQMDPTPAGLKSTCVCDVTSVVTESMFDVAADFKSTCVWPIASLLGVHFLTACHCKSCHTLKASEVYGNGAGQPGVLFAAAINPSDVHQGLLGDCYFLGSLACLADTHPDKLRALFLKGTDLGTGRYEVQFYKMGQPVTVVVDDWVPCHAADTVQIGRPAFSSSKSNELWVLILEKAWAKLHGSYLQIEAGRAGAEFFF